MTATDPVQAVAEALIAHTRLPSDGRCSCGHVRPLGHSFAEHQAEAAVAAARPTIEREAKMETERLRHLLGSHSDGHRCTCTMTDPGVYFGSNMHPPEWEQDPWCPTHPDVDYIKTEVAAREREAKAAAWDEGFDAGHQAARAVNPEWPEQPTNPYRIEPVTVTLPRDVVERAERGLHAAVSALRLAGNVVIAWRIEGVEVDLNRAVDAASATQEAGQ